MATTAQAYGLIPVNHPTGQSRASKYNILNNAGTGYGTAIYKGDLVKVHTDGTINIGDGTSAALGVFAGCEYIDPTGKPVVSPYWPASTLVQAGSEIKAYVYDDPANVYRVGVTANASGYVQTAVGQQANVTIAAGNVNTGISGSNVDAALVAAGTAAQCRIVGFFDGPYSATDNPFPQLLVQINELQFAANAVGV
jgi:hypothetical protein